VPLAIGAWGLGLLGVVGAALAGGIGDERVAEAPPEPSGALAVAPVALPAPSIEVVPPVASSVILLDWPATPTSVVTTRDMVVRGHVPEDSGPVVVMLESRSPERMIVVTVNPTRLPARDIRGMSAFRATLTVPDPRPTGPAVVHVIAFDAGGDATEVLLRTIQIGAVVDPTYGDGSARPPTGEDGLMGGIPYGTNFAWQADGGQGP
jgi:hypothetical protein